MLFHSTVTRPATRLGAEAVNLVSGCELGLESAIPGAGSRDQQAKHERQTFVFPPTGMHTFDAPQCVEFRSLVALTGAGRAVAQTPAPRQT
jgi:hypothetical protein